MATVVMTGFVRLTDEIVVGVLELSVQFVVNVAMKVVSVVVLVIVVMVVMEVGSW